MRLREGEATGPGTTTFARKCDSRDKIDPQRVQPFLDRVMFER
ncbi:MAG: hypothetical protein ACREUQ_09350 [Burkholderiales bacterium]